MTGRVAAAFAIAALALGACGSTAPAATPDLVIGAIYPLAGPQAGGGTQELDGVRTALEVAQRSGVLGQRHVVLRVENAVSPQGAVNAVDRLIDTDHVSVIIGTYGSTLAQASAARANARHVVYWETGAVADGITIGHPYVFRTVATGSTLGTMAVEFTDKVLLAKAGLAAGAVRAVIVHVDDVYGRSVAAGEAALAARYGIKVVDTIAYDAAAYDPAAIVARLAADHPDYLWDVSYLGDGEAIWRTVVSSGVHLRAAVGTSSAFCMPAFGLDLGAAAVGVYAADKPDEHINPAALSLSGRALLASARAAYAAGHPGKYMEIPTVAGFVGGWTLFHDVLPRVGLAPTADEVRSAAMSVDVPAGDEINGGGVKFGPEGSPDAGQNQRAAAMVGEWVGVALMEVVYPPTYATSKPA